MISPDLRFLPLMPTMITFIESAVTEHCLGYMQIQRNIQKRFPHFDFDRLAVKKQILRLKRREKEKGPIVAEAIQLWQLLTEEKANDPSLMVSYTIKDKRLTQLFWMTGIQQQLYRQYSDVLVVDTTFGTNRFQMPLHQFVVVDSNFKTRLVANAITAGEKQFEYEWVLEELLKTMDNTQPGAIILDKDPSMIGACDRKLQSTRQVNCLWHGKGNLKKHLKRKLGEQWSQFLSDFTAASHSIAEPEFMERWNNLFSKYSTKDDKAKEYLERLFDDRHHWVWAWTQTVFTAGMQSTQRVEKEHDLVKMLGANSKSTLAEVIQATTARSKQEFYHMVYSQDAEGQKAQARAQHIQDPTNVKRAFGRILDTNMANLSAFAFGQMEGQMSLALVYSCRETDLERIVSRTCTLWWFRF